MRPSESKTASPASSSDSKSRRKESAAASALPGWELHLFDAQPIDGLPRRDGRTLALSLGSIQWLRRLQAWPAGEAEPMTEVSVSQVPPGGTEVRLSARELGVSALGAVLPYGALHAALQRRWLDLASPRLVTRGSTLTLRL